MAASKTRIKICKHEGCHNAQTTDGFCRLHYLRNWRLLKAKQQKAASDRLNKYVERMSKQYPQRFVDEIRKELRSRNFENIVEDEGEADEIAAVFNGADFTEEVDQLIAELKIEKEF